jgi:hypothetical protein
MAKFIMKNGSFWIQKYKNQAKVVITAAVKGPTTQLTIANTLAVGDVVVVEGSGWSSLDGKAGEVVTATSSSLTVKLDTSAEVANFGAAAKATLIASADWLEACLAGLDIDSGTTDSIATGTFCDAGAAIAGAGTNGTVNINGFVDPNDAGYQELLKASEDGVPRNFKLVLPKAANPGAAGSNGGTIYFTNATVGSISQSFQVGQAATFSGSLILGAKPLFVPAV